MDELFELSKIHVDILNIYFRIEDLLKEAGKYEFNEESLAIICRLGKIQQIAEIIGQFTNSRIQKIIKLLEK